MNLTIEPIWPLYRVLITIAALIVLVLITYPQRVRHLRPFDRRLLIGVRLAVIGLIAVAMFRPAMRIRSTDNETRFLYILADSSRSMGVPDGAGVSGENTRRQQLLRMMNDHKELFEQFDENVEIRYVDYAESLNEVNELEDITTGQQTRLAEVLRETFQQTRGKKLLGIILLGDGAPRTFTADRTVDQRQLAITAAADFGRRSTRIHTVPFGGVISDSTAGDLIVSDIQCNPNPYEGKVVTVTATIRNIGAKGRRLTAKILVEERTGIAPPSSGIMRDAKPLKTSTPKNNKIVPTSDDDVQQIELSFVPQRPGKYKIAFQIEGLRDERNTTNNIITRIIDVQSGGISVAYFDRIRPEQRFLRNVTASDKIQLDYFPVTTGSGFGRTTKIDPAIFQSGTGEYDVFILGDVPAKIFGEHNLTQLRKRVKEGAGLIMIGGYNNFGAGGYAGSPIDELLPVEMTRNEFTIAQANKNSPLLQHNRQLQMVPTALGLTRFVMRIAANGEHEKLWKQLAPLEAANRLRKKGADGNSEENLIEVLAATPDGKPLLLSHVWNGARVMAFGGDTTYQWYLNGHQAVHQRFWRQIILYLSGKDEGNEPVWVQIQNGGQRSFGVEDTIPLQFGARNEKGEPLKETLNYDVQVMRFISDTTDPVTERKLQLSGKLERNSREIAAMKSPGEYWVRVTARKNDPQKTIVGTAWERFLIQSVDLELDNPAADPDLLKEIARATGGTFVDNPEQFGDFLKRLTVPGDELTGTDTVTLWDTWPHFGHNNDHYLPGLLLLFVLLISFEWFWRKRRGLV